MDLKINQECIICFEQIDDKEIIKLNKLNIFPVECEHKYSYHDTCINNWIKDCIKNKIIPSCPLCRHDIKYNIPNETRVDILTQDNSNNKCQILCCIMVSTIILLTVSITMKNLFMQ